MREPCSWAGLCPRSDESAGKRRSTKLRQGAPWLKTLLVKQQTVLANAMRGLAAEFGGHGMTSRPAR